MTQLNERVTDSFEIEELEYLRHGKEPLLARVFKPRQPKPFPMVIEAHGGAWVNGTRMNNEAINRALASRGIGVAALDFRAPPSATYPGSVADIHFGIRWLKANAARFGSRPDWVGAMGSSSGGHLAVLASMKPHDPRYAAIPLPHGNEDATVPYVVALWPVICPLGRYRYLKNRPRDPSHGVLMRGVESQEFYWGSEEAMGEGSPAMALERGDQVSLPDMIYFQNEEDNLHPRADVDRFVKGYRAAGGKLNLQFFSGATYDYIRVEPDCAEANRVFEMIADFVKRHALP